MHHKSNDLKNIETKQNKLKEFIKLFYKSNKAHNQLINLNNNLNSSKAEIQNKIDLEFILDKISINIFEDDIESSSKVSLEFEKFYLNVNLNNYFISINFDLYNIDLNNFSFNQKQTSQILFSKRELSEKLIKIKIIFIQREIWDSIEENLKFLINFIKDEFNNNFNIKEISKTDILFDLSNMTLNFVPLIINNTLKILLKVINLEKKIDHEDEKKDFFEDNNEIEKASLIKEEDKVIKKNLKIRKSLSSENLNKNMQVNENKINNFNKIPDIQRKDSNNVPYIEETNENNRNNQFLLNSLALEFTIKSLDIFIFNKKTNLKLFSFGLSESKISVSQNSDELQIFSNLGNFIISEHLNFPNFKYDLQNHENNLELLKNKSNEILGLVDKNKNSSLIVKVNILNEYKSKIENGKKIKTFVDIKVESIKLNLVYKTLLRIVDCIIYDIIASFNKINQDTLNKDKPSIENENDNNNKKIVSSKSFLNLNKNKILDNSDLDIKRINQMKEYYEVQNKNDYNENNQKISKEGILQTLENDSYKNKNEIQLIEFTSIIVDISNPTIFLFDLYNDKRFYKLDFGKIKVSNSIDLFLNHRFYYSNFHIEFNNVNIFSWDNYSICNLLSINLKFSSYETLNKKDQYNNNFDREKSKLYPNQKLELYEKQSLSNSILNIYISEFNVKLRKVDYKAILILIKNNFSLDDSNDQYLFEKNKIQYNNGDDQKNLVENNKTAIVDESHKIIKFSLLVNMEIFRFQIIDKAKNFLEFFLIETNFDMKNYSNKDNIKFTAQNIYLKDNQISILSNKKGIENSEQNKNYCQLNVMYQSKKEILSENGISIFNDIDVSLIDLKIFVKLDLIKFLTDFFNLDHTSKGSDEDEKNKIKQEFNIGSLNKDMNLDDKKNLEEQEIKNIEEQSSFNNKSISNDIKTQNLQKKDNKRTNIKISISNNIFFLRSEDNFYTQQILALEGDLLLELNLSEDIYKNLFICNKEYKIDENISLDCSLQNFAFFSAFVDSFESDFEKLYNKKLLIEPANFFIDFKNKIIKDLDFFEKNKSLFNIKNNNSFQYSEKGYFEKKEVLMDIDKIKLKVSFNDIFFIVNTLIFNVKKMTEEEKIKEEENGLSIRKSKNSFKKEFFETENNFDVNSIKSKITDLSEKEINIDNKNQLNKSENIISDINSAEKKISNKFENLLELFFKFSNFEIFIINDLNNMFCPIFQLILSETEATIFKDIYENLKCNYKSELKLNYFNYKISFWEPAIEKFDFTFLIQDENYSLMIPNQININVNQEFIFLIKNSIESLKNKYEKVNLLNEKEGEIKEINVSNNIVINYSGDEIIFIRQNNFLRNSKIEFAKEPNLKDYVEIKIANGEFFDLDAFNSNNYLPKNLYYENSKDNESIVIRNKLIDNVIFKNRNLNLQNFSLEDPFIKSDKKRIKRGSYQKSHNKISFNKNVNNNLDLDLPSYSEIYNQNQDEINYNILEENNIECLVELDKIRKNYIFYSDFLFSNQTQFSVELQIINKARYNSGILNEYLIKKFNTLGLRDFKQNFILILNLLVVDKDAKALISQTSKDIINEEIKNNNLQYEIPYDLIIEKENSYIEIKQNNFFFILKIEKNILNNINMRRNKEFTFFKLTLMPLIKLKNILPFEVNLKFNNNNLNEYKHVGNPNEINLLSEKEIDLFFDINMFHDFNVKCNNFIIKNISLNINADDFLNHNLNTSIDLNNTINTFNYINMNSINNKNKNPINNQNEKVFEISLNAFNNNQREINKKNEQEIIIKINITRIDGVYYFHLYSDFIIINTTNFNIFPIVYENFLLNSKNNKENNTVFSEFDNFNNENNLEFSCTGVNDVNLKMKYFLTREFFKCKYLLQTDSKKVFLSEELNISPDNYAYTDDFLLTNIYNQEEKYQFAIERVIKYVKFKNMKKIDILILKPKYILENNLNYDIQIENKIIKAKSEEPFYSENGLLKIKLINYVNYAENENSESAKISSVWSEEMQLDSFFDNHIFLSFDEKTKANIEIKNEVKGINSIVTLNQSTLENSEFIIENKTNYLIRLYQILSNNEKEKSNLNNYILLDNERVNYYNWTKINITRHLAIDLIDMRNINKVNSIENKDLKAKNLHENFFQNNNLQDTPINSPIRYSNVRKSSDDNNKYNLNTLNKDFIFDNCPISDFSDKSLAISKNYSANSNDYLKSVYTEKELNDNIVETYIINYDDINEKYKNDYNKFISEFHRLPNIKIKIKYKGETCFLSITDKSTDKNFELMQNENKFKKNEKQTNYKIKDNTLTEAESIEKAKKLDDKNSLEKLKLKKFSQIIINVKCINISLMTSELLKQNMYNYQNDKFNLSIRPPEKNNDYNKIKEIPNNIIKMLRKEIINIHLEEISIISITEVKNELEKNISMQFKLQSLQVDNITENNLSPYKINIFKILNKTGNLNNNSIENLEKEVAFLDFILEYKVFKLKNNRERKHIEKIDFLIQSFGICLDSEILYDLLIFTKSLQININETFYSKSIKEILLALGNSYLSESTESQQNTEKFSLNKTNRDQNRNFNSMKHKGKDAKKQINYNRLKNASNDKLYIEFLRTSPINLLLSYKNINDKFFEELNISSRIIKNIIDLFSNNENVNIKLNAVEFNHIQGSAEEIAEKITKYYSKNLFYQILKLLFSIDILGNPLKLLSNFGSGVKDFFYMPIQGLRNGPLDFVMGSYTGTKSLLSHAVGGVLDSTEKITFSIKKYLLKITNSDDYNRERQDLYNRSLNGKSSKFSNSMKIIALGIKYGFRDFLFLPYFYYKNFGILSFPKGVFMGFTSLFVKPISGCLDFLSFFSGNMAKNFLYAYDFTYKNLHRKREARIFWGKNKFIRAYNFENKLIDKFIESSTIINFLKEHDSITDTIYHINDPEIIVKNVFFARKAQYDEKNKRIFYEITILYFVNDFIFIVDDYKQRQNLIFASEKNNVINISTIKDIIFDNNTPVNEKLNSFKNMKEIDSLYEKVKLIYYETENNLNAQNIKNFRINDEGERNLTFTKAGKLVKYKTLYLNENLEKEKDFYFDSQHIKQAFLSYMFEKINRE